MKLSQSRRGFLAVVIAGACLLPSVSSAAITVIGSGPDSSYLILESPNLGIQTYEIHYTYNSLNPQDAWFLLSQVATEESYTVAKTNYGSESEPNYYISSINGETGTSTFPYLYWAHWVSGGLGFQGPGPDYNYDPGVPPLESWTAGYGVSTHLIAPGSSDALVYSDGSSQPSFAPIPETSSAVLGVLGSFVIFRRRRNG
ncbi:MAG: hypothetical protein ABIS50_24960 [Luteolibacter sp.]|uniref:hypothetical protein n=1 Tax=Luteolibacter sp. TaxID=1962973 RepID=UPI0032672A60